MEINYITSVFALFAITFSSLESTRIESKVYEYSKIKIEKTASGEKRSVLKGETAHCANFEIHETTLNPGYAPHGSQIHNDSEELVIVKEGKVKITLNNISKILGPGSVALILPGDEHGLINASNDSLSSYLIVKYKTKSNQNHEQGKLAGGSMLIDWNELVFKPHNRGGVRKYFDRKSTLSQRIEMHVTTLNPGITSHSPHIHGPEEIIIMMEGTTEMEIGDQKYQGKSGDIYFLGNDKPHGIHNTGNKPCMYMAFQWE